MAPDLEQAKRYLSLLDQYPECLPNRFLFSAFDDTETEQPPRSFYGTLDDYAAELQELNAKGYGIFVCVNATSGYRRRHIDLVAVSAKLLVHKGFGPECSAVARELARQRTPCPKG